MERFRAHLSKTVLASTSFPFASRLSLHQIRDLSEDIQQILDGLGPSTSVRKSCST